MADTRIGDVVVDAQDVAKSPFRVFIEGSLVSIFSDADAVRSEDLSPMFLINILSLNAFFEKDTGSTDPDDGISVIIDTAGNHWIRKEGGGSASLGANLFWAAN